MPGGSIQGPQRCWLPTGTGPATGISPAQAHRSPNAQEGRQDPNHEVLRDHSICGGEKQTVAQTSLHLPSGPPDRHSCDSSAGGAAWGVTTGHTGASVTTQAAGTVLTWTCLHSRVTSGILPETPEQGVHIHGNHGPQHAPLASTDDEPGFLQLGGTCVPSASSTTGKPL